MDSTTAAVTAVTPTMTTDTTDVPLQATETSCWREQYAQAVAGTLRASSPDAKSAAGPTGSDSTAANVSVQRFLERVLREAPLIEAQLTVARIGEALCVPLADLSTKKLQKEQTLDSSAVLRVLQLQVICRLCCCCTSTATTAAKKKKKVTKQQMQANKKARAAQRKRTKTELRSLLDRIALLLDAANPPSMTDDDDRSHFHEFLQDVLAPAFVARLPKLVAFLLSVYELADETRELANMALSAPAPPPALAGVGCVQPTATASSACATPPAPPSVLSALLRDEQRPLKRSRTETAVLLPFKNMELPHPLQRRASFPSTRRDVFATTATRSTAVLATASSPSITLAASSRRSSGSSAKKSATTSNSSSRSSSKPRSSSSSTRRSSSSTKKPQTATTGTTATSVSDNPRLARVCSAPLLVRDTHRSLVAGPQSRFTPSASNRTPHTATVATGVAARPLLNAAPLPRTGLLRAASSAKPPIRALQQPPSIRSAVANVIASDRSSSSNASVVMRTPERPQRRQQRTARVLIASSPPFRNPNVGSERHHHQQQRKGPSGIPPPLLR